MAQAIQAIPPRRPQYRPAERPFRRPAAAAIRPAVELASLKGDVHRFSAVVDRFGRAVKGGTTVRTVCLRELRLDGQSTPLRPDHWWFPLRQVWSEAGIRAGDTVLFTAKVQQCTKGWGDPHTEAAASGSRGMPHGNRRQRQREQVVGFAREPRDVVVIGRRQGVSRQLSELNDDLIQTTAQLEETRADLQRTAAHRDVALQQAAPSPQLLHTARSQLQVLQRRARRAGALLLCLAGACGFALGWSSAGWKQAQAQQAPAVVAASAPSR
jgi:hypothetical protein